VKNEEVLAINEMISQEGDKSANAVARYSKV
jgi:hypothetical protein